MSLAYNDNYSFEEFGLESQLSQDDRNVVGAQLRDYNLFYTVAGEVRKTQR